MTDVTGKELLERNYPEGSPARKIAETVASIDERLAKAAEISRLNRIKMGRVEPVKPEVVAEEKKS
ncbi:MAG: hypothetical protein AAB697_01805 [Patescibacteria group bacterium]